MKAKISLEDAKKSVIDLLDQYDIADLYQKCDHVDKVCHITVQDDDLIYTVEPNLPASLDVFSPESIIIDHKTEPFIPIPMRISVEDASRTLFDFLYNCKKEVVLSLFTDVFDAVLSANISEDGESIEFAADPEFGFIYGAEIIRNVV